MSESKHVFSSSASAVATAEVDTNAPAVESSSSLLRDYFTLTKPEITFLVAISALAGFLLGSPGGLDWFTLFVTIVGVVLSSAGAAVLNHATEAPLDAVMKRTSGRPIATGRIPVQQAKYVGYFLIAAGIGILCPLTNPLTAILAGIAAAAYVFVYTPLKRKTEWNTLVGTIPGALPALGGWTAATGNLHAGGWAIFLILAAWQMPHFLALAWMYRKDYARGGFVMTSVNDPTGIRTSGQAMFFTVLMVLVSILPFALGLAGAVYLAGAVFLGGWFLVYSFRFLKERTGTTARGVLKASIYYIPLLVALIAVDHLI